MAGVEKAKQLLEEIGRHAREHEYKELFRLAADPGAHQLLRLLPERELRQAEVHLDAARFWRAQQNEKLAGKLDEAARALKGLDLQLARGILRKVDWEILDDEKLDRFNQLFLAVEARAVELEQLSEVAESSPPQRSRRFWRS